jgi:tetratricopeptide (TPR) repeat protein
MSYPDLLLKLAEEISTNPIILFSGAGISKASGIPLAGEIIDEVLSTLRLSKEDVDSFKGSHLPFEAFIETLIQTTDSENIYAIFRQGFPNSNHILFYHLARKGYIRAIITTNFDTHFEDVFSLQGEALKTYWLDEELGQVGWNLPCTKLIKLHGSVSDKKSLAITIHKVANQRSASARSKVIEQIFSNPEKVTVLVVGYSCSDNFDINPAIRKIENPRSRIILVSHVDDANNTPTVEELSTSIYAGPFTKYPGYVLRCNTDELIKCIWEVLLNSSPPLNPKINKEWVRLIERWYNEAKNHLKEITSYYIAGLLFKASLNLNRSNYFLKNAINNTTGENIAVQLHQYMGDNFRDLGNLNESTFHLEQALILARKKGLLSAQARAFASLGIIKADQKLPGSAIEYYQKARELAKKSGEIELMGICIGNIGIELKNIGGKDQFIESIKYHKQAMAIARQEGDKRSEMRTLINLGVTHADLGRRMKAIDYYRQARSIAKELGDIYHEAASLVNEAEDISGVDREGAINLLKEAISIFESIGSQQWVSYCKEKLRDIN